MTAKEGRGQTPLSSKKCKFSGAKIKYSKCLEGKNIPQNFRHFLKGYRLKLVIIDNYITNIEFTGE